MVAEQMLDAIERYELPVQLLGYAFDDEKLWPEINGLPVLCNTYDAWDRFREDESVHFLYQMYRGDLVRERAQLLESFGIPRERLYTFIHPSATVARSASIGPGTAICANTVVNPNARIGACVTINSGCLVGHDTEVGDYNFFGAHVVVGSNVRLGEANFIGLNSTIRNFIEIGDEAMIGAGSNVVKPVESTSLVYGNPARARGKLGNPIR